MTSTYGEIIAVLRSCLSTVNAQGALDRALARINLDADTFHEHHVSAVLPYLERSLKLFVDRAHLPAIVAGLESRGKAKVTFRSRVVEIAREQDLSEARNEAQALCQDLGTPSLTRQKVLTVVSELTRNIILYAQRGRLELAAQMTPRKRIVVRATDHGPGISNLDVVLGGQYTSKTGLGRGLRGCKRLADRFEIETDSTGTRIEAEIHV